MPVPAVLPLASRSVPNLPEASSLRSVTHDNDRRDGDEDEDETPHTSTAVRAPGRQQSYEYTDLDLLVARLDSPAAAEQGASYDDLLILSDVIGPANPSRSASHIRAVEDLPVAPIMVERRRVTKDGRKKLKLSLMGIIVDRCSVCMSQFKPDEHGVLLPCQHS